MSDYGIKVSLPGADVNNATPEECAVHSGFPSPKIKVGADPAHFGIIRVDFNQSPPTDGNDITLFQRSHGYGHKPAVLGTIFLPETNPSRSSDLYSIMPWTPTATVAVWLEATDTQMRLRMWQSFDWFESGDEMFVSFYIFAEDGL